MVRMDTDWNLKKNHLHIIMFSAPWWKGNIVKTGTKKHLKPRIDLKQHFSHEGKTKSVPWQRFGITHLLLLIEFWKDFFWISSRITVQLSSYIKTLHSVFQLISSHLKVSVLWCCEYQIKHCILCLMIVLLQLFISNKDITFIFIGMYWENPPFSL